MARSACVGAADGTTTGAEAEISLNFLPMAFEVNTTFRIPELWFLEYQTAFMCIVR